MNLIQHQEALRKSYEKKTLRLIQAPVGGEEKLRELLGEWPSLYPPWTGLFHEYDNARFGPLLAVSDEGSAAQTIAEAAYASAKARALASPDPMAVGMMIDGERMSSAGEAPIGPNEYEQLINAAFGRTLCSTNVGVRANARLYRLFPEFHVADAAGKEDSWVAQVFSAFSPFLNTPDRKPRPLGIHLVVTPKDSDSTVGALVRKIEEGRSQGLLAPSPVHRLSLLMIFDHQIQSTSDIDVIKEKIALAAQLGVPEVAMDGGLTFGARERMSVQSLLNVVDVPTLTALFAEARSKNVSLTYRYQVDTESAARTIWTGLHAARSYGFTVGKYGLVPLTLEEQLRVIELVSRWTKGWSAIPAFYADTPLVTRDEVFDPSRCFEAALLWMHRVRTLGVSMVLIDCPDRVTPRHLLREDQDPAAKGAFTLDQATDLQQRAMQLGIKILWSGGITAKQAFALAARRAFAIFSTSATTQQVAVHGTMAKDPALPAEGEPTPLGVRRVQAAIEAGFLSDALLPTNKELASQIAGKAGALLKAIDAQQGVEPALNALDEVLRCGWQEHWRSMGPLAEQKTMPCAGVAVPPNAVRVWRGWRAVRHGQKLPPNEFHKKLSAVFMPLTVQMQRQYGLTAYLPAVLPPDMAAALPDEIALVFYKTQGAYDNAKKFPGGRAYSDLHSVVFDLDKSGSGFPDFLGQSFSFGKPYHLLQNPADWKAGAAHLYVGTRKRELTVDSYSSKLHLKAQNVQKNPGPVDGAVLFASEDWMLYWQHSASAKVPIPNFFDITDPVLDRDAECKEIPVHFTSPPEEFSATPGNFFNFQFSTVD